MREELKQRVGLRGRFTATFKRFGQRKCFDGRPPIDTALFVDVCDEASTQVADHLWFVVGKGWRSLNLQAGDRVCFEARVTTYIKGYRGHRDFWEEDCHRPVTTDYKLARPTSLRKVSQLADAALPLFSDVPPASERERHQ